MSTHKINDDQQRPASAGKGDLHRPPFSLPDGYFESFKAKVMSELPEYPQKPKAEAPRSLWGKLKPYVYLAAMFLGVWCMMKVYHSVAVPSANLDNPPENVVLALNDPDTYEFYSSQYADDPFSDLEQDAMSLTEEDVSYDFEDLEKDFGVEIKPMYNNIKI